ncbi:hypothetical protein SynMVIR181_01146 [Synechococcus sp. MVIR-18-1]|nr:hypothetical protein SynMVIR181_01146 [Synechococcus sp. MVIR-18-1]
MRDRRVAQLISMLRGLNPSEAIACIHALMVTGEASDKEKGPAG